MDWHSRQHRRFDDVPEPIRFIILLALVAIATLAPLVYPNMIGLGFSVFILLGLLFSRMAYHATHSIKTITKVKSNGTTKS